MTVIYEYLVIVVIVIFFTKSKIRKEIVKIEKNQNRKIRDLNNRKEIEKKQVYHLQV